MATQAFDVTAFKTQFPEFATTDPTMLAAYWDMATQYVNPNDGPFLSGATLLLAVNLMTAHLSKSFLIINYQQSTPGVVQSASEGGVNVSLTPPPVKNAWQWWLATTAYGMQLWALLQVQSAGGVHVGGSLERCGFRKAGGAFF